LIGCPATITCPPQTLAFGCPKTITCPPHTIPFLHCPPIRSRFPWTCPITMRPPCLTITAPINTLACPDPQVGGGGRPAPGLAAMGGAEAFAANAQAQPLRPIPPSLICPVTTTSPQCRTLGIACIPTAAWLCHTKFNCPSAHQICQSWLGCPTQLCPTTNQICQPTRTCPSAVDACPTRFGCGPLTINQGGIGGGGVAQGGQEMFGAQAQAQDPNIVGPTGWLGCQTTIGHTGWLGCHPPVGPTGWLGCGAAQGGQEMFGAQAQAQDPNIVGPTGWLGCQTTIGHTGWLGCPPPIGHTGWLGCPPPIGPTGWLGCPPPVGPTGWLGCGAAQGGQEMFGAQAQAQGPEVASVICATSLPPCPGGVDAQAPALRPIQPTLTCPITATNPQCRTLGIACRPTAAWLCHTKFNCPSVHHICQTWICTQFCPTNSPACHVTRFCPSAVDACPSALGCPWTIDQGWTINPGWGGGGGPVFGG
jgi:hypothetical protein